ncbi:hypothetical protein MVEN_01119100 [Mycena venus]|uniref:MYND-type domain-containing protein n=1 Tax=Mycena venus TaxID=2733690 RepID=A0A8H6Y9G1_9AGAR|nr:hypothetical protein MVEN_01119100 [Mycena venus]
MLKPSLLWPSKSSAVNGNWRHPKAVAPWPSSKLGNHSRHCPLGSDPPIWGQCHRVAYKYKPSSFTASIPSLDLCMSPTPHYLQPLLASALGDPLGSGALCAHALYSAIVQVLMCGPSLPYQVKFLKAAMKFMATQRSPPEHARLRARLLSCECNICIPEIRMLHGPMPPTFTAVDKLNFMLFYLCKALRMAVFAYQPKLHDAAKRWPAAEKDINPFSVPLGQLCDGLLSWAEDPSSGYGVFTLIGTMCVLSAKFELEVLATPRVFQYATSHLQHALDNIPTHDTKNLWAPRFSSRVFACAGNLFQDIARNKARTVDHILTCVNWDQMRAIARQVQPYLEPNASQGGDMCDSVAWFDAVRAREGRQFLPSGRPAAAMGNPENAYLQVAWGHLVTMRSRKCTRRACMSETALEESKMCGGCGVARYCGVEHQRDAWNSPQHPHKKLCSAIQDLRRAIHLEKDDAWTRLIHDTESRRAPHQFLALCDQYGVNPSLGKAILAAVGVPLTH